MNGLLTGGSRGDKLRCYMQMEGVGKSQIILQLLTSICLGERWFGLGTAKGTALYLGAEDDLEELHRRYNDIIGAGLL